MSSVFSPANPARDPGRIAAIAVIAAVHAGLIYGFMQWRVHLDVSIETAPVQVALIAENVEATDLTPPPEPRFETPVVTIEAPVIDLPQLADPSPTISVVYRSEVSPKPVVAAPMPKLVSTVEYLRPLKPLYPPTSRRLHEEGLVVLLVLVDEVGRASRIEVRDSSGHQRLDRAAHEAVERARFKPYLEDGVARPALVLIPVEFTLNQRVAQR